MISEILGFKRGWVKMRVVYKRNPTGKVKVKQTNFMKRASVKTMSKTEVKFIGQIKRQLVLERRG